MSSLPNGEHFTLWIFLEQQAVMTFLGKLVNPVTGRTERSLEAARWHIDLLGAIAERTRGNLAPDEDRLLTQVLTNLRLNFVQEAARPEASGSDAGETGSGAAGDAATGAAAADAAAADAAAGDAAAKDAAAKNAAAESTTGTGPARAGASDPGAENKDAEP